MIPVFRPSTNNEELEAVKRVLDSGWIGLGPETEKLEKNLEKFLGHEYVITTNAATSALHLALVMAGVDTGDEVISPALTFVSTNHVILYQSAIPVFSDIDPETLCTDPQDVIRKITPKTKAIIVVHYGGHAVDMDPLIAVCKQKNITLIEDAAHALGGTYKGKMLGTIGDFGCFSFHAVKSLAMGDGGAIFTKNKDIAAKLKQYRWMGISKDTWKRVGSKQFSWQYDVNVVGYKYHTNDILAAIGNVQLKKLPNVLVKKRKLLDLYNEKLNAIPWLKTPVEKAYTTHGLHNYCIKTPYRDALSAYLSKKEISTSVHYVPNNHYEIYKSFSADIPVTEKIWKEILLLPFFTDLSSSEVEYIVSTIRSFKNSS